VSDFRYHIDQVLLWTYKTDCTDAVYSYRHDHHGKHWVDDFTQRAFLGVHELMDSIQLSMIDAA
jgi:hypothetical protein